MRFASVFLISVLLLFAACEQPQQPALPPAVDTAGWERIELFPAISWAAAINDEGTIVGVQRDAAWLGHPFVRSGDGRVETLQPEVVFGSEVQPVAVNSSSQIVGVASNASRLVVWDSPHAVDQGVPLLIDPAIGESSSLSLVGLSDAGTIVANVWTDDGLGGHFDVLAWQNGVRHELGFLAAAPFAYPSTYAYRVNSRGEIVGQSEVALVTHSPFSSSRPTEVFHPFLWQDGVMRDLGVLGHYPCRDVAAPRDCSSGSAIDINELGVVLGWSLDADGRSRAFVWKKGVMQELDVFPGRSITPVAINDREQILGRAGPTVFLWDQGRTQIIIESDSVAPQALGSHGEVIGVRLRPNNHLEAWVWRAGLLTELGPGLPTHINKAGDIIGYFSDDGYTAAILWRKRRMGAP